MTWAAFLWMIARRPALWVLLGITVFPAVIVLLATSLAHGAVNPDQQPSLIRPQTAKDAKQPKSRCMSQRIIILYTRGANGEPVPMIAALVSVPCEK